MHSTLGCRLCRLGLPSVEVPQSNVWYSHLVVMTMVLVPVAMMLGAQQASLDVRTSGPDLLVNGTRIHTFGAPLGGESPSQLAERSALVLKGFDGKVQFTKKAQKQNCLVLMGSRTVMVVTPAEAKTRNVSVSTLAATVTQRLINASKLPAIAIGSSRIELPESGSTSLALTGWATRKAVIETQKPGIVEIQRTEGAISLTGKSPGETILTIKFANNSVEIPVSVMPYAFKKGENLSALVMGNPADKSAVAGAITAALQTRSASPTTNRVWARVLDAQPLLPGQTKTFRAKVKATGPNCFPFDGEVTMSVTNIGASVPKENELWYSNEPERLTKTGRLYYNELPANRSVRLLYHHQNAYSVAQIVRYMIANPTDKPARLAVSLGDSDPDRNPTRAGYKAGNQFLQLRLRGSAEIIDVPPRTVVPITVRRLRTGETCSGIATLALQGDGAEKVAVVGDCILQQTLYDGWHAGENFTGAWHIVSPKSIAEVRINQDINENPVFPEPFKDLQLDYEVGGRFGFARIGDVPIKNSSKNTSLAGNFGVIYNIRGQLKNSTPAPAEVELLFEASAGYGSGLFVLNGEMIKIGLIQPKQEIVLASIKIPSGTTKPLNIQTMPLSGANYPVTLIVRPIGFELLSQQKR